MVYPEPAGPIDPAAPTARRHQMELRRAEKTSIATLAIGVFLFGRGHTGFARGSANWRVLRPPQLSDVRRLK
jgi:hypothetical protein